MIEMSETFIRVSPTEYIKTLILFHYAKVMRSITFEQVNGQTNTGKGLSHGALTE